MSCSAVASGSRRSRMIAAKRAQSSRAERLGGAARRRDAVIVELEDVAQVVPRVRVVLDHQDVERRRGVHGDQRGRCRPPPRAPRPVVPASSSSSGTSNGL